MHFFTSAHVSCLVNEAALEMKICYVPHEGVDLSREDVSCTCTSDHQHSICHRNAAKLSNE